METVIGLRHHNTPLPIISECCRKIALQNRHLRYECLSNLFTLVHSFDRCD